MNGCEAEFEVLICLSKKQSSPVFWYSKLGGKIYYQVAERGYQARPVAPYVVVA
jgi:hypothetical protein